MPVNEQTWRAKIPLRYVLLFLLNIALVVLVEIAFLYTQPRVMTPEILAEVDPVYENCTVIQRSSSGSLVCYLVKTQEGDTYLLASRQHGFFRDRYRLLTSQTTLIPEEESTTVTVRMGLLPVRISVENGFFAAPVTASSNHMRELTTRYLVWGALLEFLEMAAYELIKKNL